MQHFARFFLHYTCMFLLVHMTREELTVGVEVDTSHSIHPTVYLLLSGGEKKKKSFETRELERVKQVWSMFGVRATQVGLFSSAKPRCMCESFELLYYTSRTTCNYVVNGSTCWTAEKLFLFIYEKDL